MSLAVLGVKFLTYTSHPIKGSLFASTLSYTSGFGYRCLPQYTGLVTEGIASPVIRQVQIDDYSSCVILLDADGNMWYNNAPVFSGYKIKYFDCFRSGNDPHTQALAAVTEEGRLVWADSKNLRDHPEAEPGVLQGVEQVKYCAAFWGVIAFVREDGTAGYCWAGEGAEINELESWSDIAMIYVNGDRDDYWNVIGLRQDGTLVSAIIYGEETICPEEVGSWTDIVDIVWTSSCVAGLKSDGSIVYALNGHASGDIYTETFGAWSNVMAFTESGAIAADNTLLGGARSLVYGWDLTKPWVSDEAAYREHDRDDKTDQLTMFD